MAGLETTAGSSLHVPAPRHPPADRQRIIDDPAVIDKAVEEFLRVHAIVLPGRKSPRTWTPRLPMQKGDMVMLPIPAANRSPSVLDHPTEVDFDRRRLGTSRSASARTAARPAPGRRELATALAVWHELIPEYSVATDEPLVERGGNLASSTFHSPGARSGRRERCAGAADRGATWPQQRIRLRYRGRLHRAVQVPEKPETDLAVAACRAARGRGDRL